MPPLVGLMPVVRPATQQLFALLARYIHLDKAEVVLVLALAAVLPQSLTSVTAIGDTSVPQQGKAMAAIVAAHC
jgi:hypothetical protein